MANSSLHSERGKLFSLMLEKKLKCPLCNDLLNPKQQPHKFPDCGHMCCQNCLAKEIGNNNETDGQVRCPKCDKIWTKFGAYKESKSSRADSEQASKQTRPQEQFSYLQREREVNSDDSSESDDDNTRDQEQSDSSLSDAEQSPERITKTGDDDSKSSSSDSYHSDDERLDNTASNKSEVQSKPSQGPSTREHKDISSSSQNQPLTGRKREPNNNVTDSKVQIQQRLNNLRRIDENSELGSRDKKPVKQTSGENSLIRRTEQAAVIRRSKTLRETTTDTGNDNRTRDMAREKIRLPKYSDDSQIMSRSRSRAASAPFVRHMSVHLPLLEENTKRDRARSVPTVIPAEPFLKGSKQNRSTHGLMQSGVDRKPGDLTDRMQKLGTKKQVGKQPNKAELPNASAPKISQSTADKHRDTGLGKVSALKTTRTIEDKHHKAMFAKASAPKLSQFSSNQMASDKAAANQQFAPDKKSVPDKKTALPRSPLKHTSRIPPCTTALHLRLSHKFGKFDGVMGIEPGPKESLVICDFDGKDVSIYRKQSNGSYKKYKTLNLTSSNPYRPVDIAITPDGDIVVARKSCAEVYSPSGKYMRTIKPAAKDRSRQDTEYQSVLALKDGRILIGDIKNSVITEHKSTGKLSRVIKTSKRPYQMAMIRDALVAVSDIEKDMVSIIDLESTHETLQIRVPMVRGICYNAQTGGILVIRSDYEASGTGKNFGQRRARLGTGVIEQYCPVTGDMIEELVEGLYYPISQCFTHDGMLAVTDKNRVVLYDVTWHT